MTKKINNESFKINRSLSGILTSLFLQSPLTPNQITSLSLGCGILSGFFFSKGTYHESMIGALAFQTATILDNCDGEIARAKNLKSVFGGWFDIVADMLTDTALFIGISLGLLRTQTPGPVILTGILCLSGGVINFLIVVLEKIRGFGPAVFDQPHPEGVERKNIFYKITDALREGDSSWFVVLFAVLNQTKYILWLGSIYMQIIWLSALFLNFKWIFSPSLRNEPYENY